MKANRKFVQADEAVSPVIAVILMVAITVVLAATVFVLVSDIGGNTATSAPAISWTADEGADKLQVSTASQNADWNRLTIQADTCTGGAGTVKVGGAGAVSHVNTAGRTLAASQAVSTGACAPPGTAVRATPAAQKIGAGDYLQFCGANAAGDGGSALLGVKVTIKDTTANSIVHTYTFTDLTACT